jgi:nitrogen regulatory protein PII
LSQNERIETICSTQRLDLVFTIVSRGKGEAVLDIFRENKILQNVICHGHGTAPSSILEVLGLGATDKDIVLSFVKAENSKKIIEQVSKKLDFAKPGHGIAFTVPLESIAGIMSFKMLTADLTEEEN